MFLYSQDLSNCTTARRSNQSSSRFLYSQDLSNCTTDGAFDFTTKSVFVLSRFK